MDQGRRNFMKAAGMSLCASAIPISMATASSVDPLSLANRLPDIVDQAIKDMASPGVQISVWREHHRVATVSRGFGNLETSAPVSPDTIFRAGSLTKQFTAALIAKLQEQGKLSVGDRLDKYLDFFRGKQAPTLLELIHHTAGIHDEQGSTIDLATVSQIDLARRIADQAQLYDFPPGSAWLYSNANYVLLGAVIESVTNTSLAQAAERLVFEPLGLKNTRFDTCAEIVKHRASGYSPSGSGDAPFTNAAYIPIEQAGGAGAIRSNARDLCLWHQSLFSGKLVSRASLEAMVAPARLKDGRPVTEGRFDSHDNNMGKTSYGYGLLLDRSSKGGGLIAMHNGFINGFSAYLATHVPSMLTVACMCNADPGPNLPFRQLRRTVFSRVL
jgi:CubicO group peptidase (beta-lactamase class C family)